VSPPWVNTGARVLRDVRQRRALQPAGV